MDQFHTSVMVREVIASLRCRAGAIYVDGTLGGAGHARDICERIMPDGLLIGIDQDPAAGTVQQACGEGARTAVEVEVEDGQH